MADFKLQLTLNGTPVSLDGHTHSFVASVVAGENIEVDSTDPANPIVHATVQAGALIFFFEDAASDVGGYKVMDNPISDPTESYAVYNTPVHEGLIQTWISEPGYPGITFVPAGVWEIHVPAFKTGGTNTSQLYAEFYTRATGGTETLLGTTGLSKALTDVEATLPTFYANIGDTILLDTDRIVCKMYVSITGVGADPSSVTVGYSGPTGARMDLPGQSYSMLHDHDGDYVMLTGDQDVAGVKTWTDIQRLINAGERTLLLRNTTLASGGEINHGAVEFWGVDNAGSNFISSRLLDLSTGTARIGQMRLQTGYANVLSTIMTLTAESGGGKVGIGTTTPNYGLHVDQKTGTGKGILLSGQEQYAEGSTGNDEDNGVLLVAGVSRNNNRQLWVGDPTFLGSSTLGFARMWGGSTGLVNLGGISGNGINELDLVLQPSGVGDVGIGGTPISRLHLFSDDTNTGTSAGITVEQAGIGDAIVQFLLPGAQRWVTGVDNSDGDKFKIASTNDLNSDARITITTGGNVGLGTASPLGRLHSYDGITNVLHYSHAAVAGTLVTVLAASQITRAVTIFYEAHVIGTNVGSGGSIFLAKFTIGANTSSFSVGGSTLTFTVNDTGSLTVQRTAGAGSFHIGLLLVWA